MNYCNGSDLEAAWTEWNNSQTQESKEILYNLIYKICCGVSKKFKPSNDEELCELTHEAFIQTITKIEKGKLKFTPGRAPAFNLLTTAIFRQLYSLKNRDSRRKKLYEKYRDKIDIKNKFKINGKFLLEVN